MIKSVQSGFKVGESLDESCKCQSLELTKEHDTKVSENIIIIGLYLSYRFTYILFRPLESPSRFFLIPFSNLIITKLFVPFV